MTKKLFEDNVMEKECGAVVENCVPMKSGFGIVLDQTVFFPEGGGQLSDVGWLETEADEKIPVMHVRIKDGIILHEINKELSVGTRVNAVLDWQIRFDHMQQHCGEHLLSYAFWKLFGCDNVGFHMNSEIVTIDLDKAVSLKEIHRAEELANKQIQENKIIRVKWMSHMEAAKLNLRKFNEKITGMLRIVSIEGSDTCTCCGTHPPATGMVGLVKIFHTEKHKEGMRIYFLCGRLALQAITQRLEALAKAARTLSVKDEEIAAGVARLSEENRQLKKNSHEQGEMLMEYQVRDLLAASHTDARGNICLTVLSDTLTANYAKELAKHLAKIPKAQALIAYAFNGRINYILSLGNEAAGDCRKVLRQINDMLNGQGGGKENFAQGSASVQHGWQELLKKII
ncbi:alanyl-tRNA editing protein [Pectinatus frisingensis]|uniref:alanyl-tRNA editing protein n=1 Tax=Pectinatus frisingensis TaxID=865 RepID=UPI0018C83F73|nr:alanine--tRNA ligase-related protein [Pectinatus frisingensis]